MKRLLFFLAVLMCCQSAFSFSKETHQYIVAQAFRLFEQDFLSRGGDTTLLRNLKQQIFYPNGQPWLSDEYQNANNPWRSLYAVAVGAAVEDSDDPIYGYSTLNGFTPSVTHFWIPDNGDDETHTMGVVDNCENLWMKARLYLFGGTPVYIEEPMIVSGTEVVGIFIQYPSLAELLMTGNCLITGYKTSIFGVTSTTTLPIPIAYTIEASFLSSICYSILGRIAHLLSDTGVPAHIHNDAHPCVMWINCDDYENWICYDQAEILYGTVHQPGTSITGDGGFVLPTDSTQNSYTFLRKLFFKGAQNTDYWPSNDYVGNDYMDTAVFYDAEIQQRYNAWGPVPAFDSNVSFLQQIAVNTLEYTIGSVASLFSWFLQETGQIVNECPAPENIMVEYLGAGRFHVVWDSTAYAQGWVLSYKKPDETIWIEMPDVSSNEVILNLEENQIYEFTISSRCALFGRGEESEIITAYPYGVGVADNDTEHTISISPNPTSGLIRISATGSWAERALSVEVYDMYGKLLRSGSVENHQLQLGQFASGVYLLKIFSDKELVGVYKVIKR